MSFRVLTLLAIACQLCTIVSSMNNTTSGNMTTTFWSDTRSYKVKIGVSGIIFSGSENPVYFKLCGEYVRGCTTWYLIEDGLTNTGQLYTYYFDADNVGDIQYMLIAMNGTDALCIRRVRVDKDNKASDTFPDCLDVDSDSDGHPCEYLNITFSNDVFTRYSEPECTLNFTNAFTPALDLPNGTAFYDVSFGVSSLAYSGSSGYFYFRLCGVESFSDITVNSENCTAWDFVGLLLADRGETYKLDYIATDVGSITWLQLTTYSSDQLCLGSVKVDGTYVDLSVGSGCLEGDDADACETFSTEIDATSNTYYTVYSPICIYPILNNDTLETVERYQLKLDVALLQGTDDNIYFTFEDRDGCQSTLYKIKNSLTSGDTFKFNVLLEDEACFATLADIWVIYLFTMGSDKVCFDWINIDDGYYEYDPYVCFSLEYSSTAVEGGCEVWKYNFVTGVESKFTNDTCGFDYESATAIGAAAKSDWLDWINDHWEIVTGSILGFVFGIILLCWLIYYCAKKKKREDGQLVGKTGYGGNSAFH